MTVLRRGRINIHLPGKLLWEDWSYRNIWRGHISAIMCWSSSLDQIYRLIDFCTKFNRWRIRYVAFNPFHILRNGPIFKPHTGLCLRNLHPSEACLRRQLFPCKLLTGLVLSISSTWVLASSVRTYYVLPEKNKSLDNAME